MAIKQLYPDIRPSLLLDFANSGTVDQRINFERLSSGTYYDKTGLLRTAGFNEPRIDFDPVTGACKGLLIEEARTNLLTYSEQFDHNTWQKNNCVVTPNSSASPDGSVTANTITKNGAYSTVYRFKAVNNGVYSCNVFLKAGSLTDATVLMMTSPSPDVIVASVQVSLLTGSISNLTGAAEVVALPDGWYRVTISGNKSSGTSCGCFIYPGVAASATTTGTILAWGAQLEAGSFPTSYIKTEAASATRAADLAVISGTAFSDFYRQGVGALFVDMTNTLANNSAYNRFVQIDDGTSNNALTLLHNPTSSPDKIFAAINDADGTGAILLSSAIVSGSRKRFAFAFSDGDSAFTDGTTLVTNSSATIDKALSVLRVCTPEVVVQQANVPIARLAYWPARLPNATLQQLTK